MSLEDGIEKSNCDESIFVKSLLLGSDQTLTAGNVTLHPHQQHSGVNKKISIK